MNNPDFKIIVITSPVEVDNETQKISMLLHAGIDYVHIRKPNASLREVKDLIEEIPFKYRKQLKLHGHFELCNEFNIGGVHLNHRCPVAPNTALSVSKSLHSIVELIESSKFDYVTLSPIFDSISKEGYKSNFNIDELYNLIADKNVIALGGVTPEHFARLKNAGFAGAALLGFIWNNNFESALKETIDYKISLSAE